MQCAGAMTQEHVCPTYLPANLAASELDDLQDLRAS